MRAVRAKPTMGGELRMHAVERRPREPVALTRREHQLDRVAERGRIEASELRQHLLVDCFAHFSSSLSLSRWISPATRHR